MHAHSSIFHNGQKVERIQMSINRGTSDVVHPYTGTLFGYKKKKKRTKYRYALQHG